MVLGIRERTGRSVTPKTDRTAVLPFEELFFFLKGGLSIRNKFEAEKLHHRISEVVALASDLTQNLADQERLPEHSSHHLKPIALFHNFFV